jgi:alpha-L-rhamnosidase
MRSGRLTANSSLRGACVALLLLIPTARAAKGQAAQIAPIALRTEMQREPLDVQTTAPRLSWLLEPSGPEIRNLHQSAYRVQVTSSSSKFFRAGEEIWDSGKKLSTQYIQQEYAGPALQSHRQYFWRVMVWDGNDHASGWSKPVSFTTGMLERQDWKARWIGAPASQNALPLFRNEFTVAKPVLRAMVYVSGLGQYELHLNGHNVTADVLTPGWTNYRRTTLYNAYDITSLLRLGTNAFGIMLGNGMYNVTDTTGRYTKFVGSFGSPRVILQAHIHYEDGTEKTVLSDDSWSTHAGPIVFSSTYGGEDFDATRIPDGWDQPGFRPAGWTPAVEIATPTGSLRGQMSPPHSSA